MKPFILFITALFSTLTIPALAVADSSFPGRAKFPDVKVIEKSQLAKQLQQVVIVDARSPLEYRTLRIKGAKNIPVSNKTFVEEIKKLRKQTKKTIVFYCNGRTCMKSYVAVKKSKKAKIKNVIAYDAGMFEWAQTYPNQAELFGASPVNKGDIITSAKFKKHLLAPDKFGFQLFNSTSKKLVLDVRDKYQRGAAGFFPRKERWVSLNDEEKLTQMILKAKNEKRTLYIYDEVGKQVRWLQYALEKAKVKNYYFMGKGAKGYYASMMKDMGISTNKL